MELIEITKESKDIVLFEKINEEAIPECERNSLPDLLSSGAMLTGIYSEGEPAGFFVTREYGDIKYLAYLAVRSNLRSKGLGGMALKQLIKEYSDKQVIVEYEAPNSKDEADDIKARRKNFYKRNGFNETGWFTFYDDTEFEIGCANCPFDIDAFRSFVEYLSSIISDHIPEPYRKTEHEKKVLEGEV